jgi:subtilase family serine protease
MSRHRALLVLISLILSALQMMAQSAVQPRITQPIDEQKLIRLQGNTHPLAQARFDRGAAPDSLPAERMLLLLQRAPDQESALQKFLQEQQTKSSPNYHRWLSPQEFGQQFGPADADIATLTAWLQSQGFHVNKVAAGRNVIEFSGTAGEVRQAFHTEIHKFVVNGEEHWANVIDPQIPAALATVVRGIVSLHNFRKKPQIKISDQRITAKLSPGPSPQVTFQNGEHALGPGDYAVIYNIKQIPAATPGAEGGSGTTIAVVGRSNINIQDVSQFRNIFGLPSNNPQVVVDGADPGNLGGGEEAEAVLDTTWSGALAPAATIKLVELPPK